SAASDRPPSTTYQPEQEQQHNCADERDEDRPGQTTPRGGDAERRENPSADECADDTDDDVADEAVAGAAHNERREHSGNQPDDQPRENCHVLLLSRCETEIPSSEAIGVPCRPPPTAPDMGLKNQNFRRALV